MKIIGKEIRLSKEVVDYLYKLIPKDKKDNSRIMQEERKIK